MNQKWYWIELIGFDRTLPDYGVAEFISRVSGDIHGISLFLFNVDFINLYDGLEKEEPILRGACSYCAHPFNEERQLQRWTNYEVRGLVETLHAHGLQVLLSIFDMHIAFDEAGNLRDGSFVQEHPELQRLDTYLGGAAGSSVCPIKRFRDGRPYSDFFIAQLKRVLVDYGFDGFHFGDGLSSPRNSIQQSDFSDDIVEQFVQATGTVFPEQLQGSCDADPEKLDARYHYILEQERYAFTQFLAGWYENFYRSMAEALHPVNKPVIFNIAWARDPFEALYRYGVDYGRLVHEGIVGLMVEDVGGCMPLYSQSGLGGFKLPVEERQYSNYDLFLTQSAIKAHLPGLMQWNMTTLKDVMEDWNIIDSAPFELHKQIVRRNNTWYSGENGYEKSSNGAFYCLSDGIPKDKWDKVKKSEDFADLGNTTGVMGLTAIWEPSILNAELERYISQRKPSVNKLLENLTYAGISICSMVRIEQIDKYPTPLLAVNPELYPQESLARLEAFTAAPLILLGYENPLKRQPERVIDEGEGGFKAYFYNCGLEAGKDVFLNLKKKQVDCSAYDPKGGTWTYPLRYDRPQKKFIDQLRKVLDGLYLYPIVVNDCNCHVITYKTGENKALMFITNDSFAAEDVQVHFPCEMESVRYVSKAEWYQSRFDKESIYLHINNRAMDVVEITYRPIPEKKRRKNRNSARNRRAFGFE